MDATVRPFSVPLSTPLTTADGSIDERSGALVEIVDGGTRGLGEATPLPGWTESLDRCRRELADAVERLERGGPAAALSGIEGAPAARHGLHLALADLEARRAGEPLYRALGADRRVESVRANATVGDGTPEATASAVEEAVGDGFDCVKLKVGAGDPSRDRRRLETARAVAGPDVELRVDANGAWDRSTAGRALEWLAEHGVAYLEQPLDAADLEGHAALRGGPVGIGLDESLAARPVGEVVAAADVAVCKPMVLGGIDRARRAALRAREAGSRAVVTTTVDGVVARAAAVHLAASLAPLPACGLATAGLLADDLAPDPAPIRDGAASVPRSPGHGVDEARVDG